MCTNSHRPQFVAPSEVLCKPWGSFNWRLWLELATCAASAWKLLELRAFLVKRDQVARLLCSRQGHFLLLQYKQDDSKRGRCLQMSIFPTKILVATDGSEEATFAARTAADIAESTGSELHVVHVRILPFYLSYHALSRAGKDLEEDLERERKQLEKMAQTLLD